MDRFWLLAFSLIVFHVTGCSVSRAPTATKADLTASAGRDGKNTNDVSIDDDGASSETSREDDSRSEDVFDPSSPEAQARYAFLAHYDGLRGAMEFLRGNRRVDDRVFRRIVPDHQEEKYLELYGQDRNRAYQAFMISFLNHYVDLSQFTSGPVGPDRGLLKAPLQAFDPNTPAIRLAVIVKSRKQCVNSANNVAANFGCDWTAVRATFPVLSRTTANGKLETLFETLEEPFNSKLNGKADSQVIGFAVTDAFADLAQARAAILTESEALLPNVPVGSISPARRLGWVKDGGKAERSWADIRRQDCRAYPVPRCAERLDAAFSDLIDREAMQGAVIMLGQ